MPIKLQCSCGQQYSARDSMAGKSVKCRKCSEAIVVPEPVHAVPAGSADDLFATDWDSIRSTPVKASTCPECHKDMPANAVLCVSCGYHQELGHKIEMEVEDDRPGHGGLLGSLRDYFAEHKRGKTVIIIAAIGIPLAVLLLGVCSVFSFGSKLGLIVAGTLIPIAVVCLIVIAVIQGVLHRSGYGGDYYGGDYYEDHHHDYDSGGGGWFGGCGGCGGGDGGDGGDGDGGDGGGCGGGCGGGDGG